MRRRTLLLLLGGTMLAGCEIYTPATPDAVAAARYSSDAPASVTLMSMIRNSTGGSAHAGLLINGSQQVLYDPAGTFTHPDLPRRGDVHYGVTPRFVDYYERYHARFDYHVETQTILVTRAEADQMIANAEAQGKTMKAHCALAVAAVLRPIPRFADVPSSYFPNALRRYFAAQPDVKTRYIREADVGKNNVWEAEAGL